MKMEKRKMNPLEHRVVFGKSMQFGLMKLYEGKAVYAADEAVKDKTDSEALKERLDMIGMRELAEHCPVAFGLLRKLGFTSNQIFKTPYHVLCSRDEKIIKAYASGVSEDIKNKIESGYA